MSSLVSFSSSSSSSLQLFLAELHIEQQRNVLIVWKLGAVVGKIVNLRTEMALDHLPIGVEDVVLYQHCLDVSSTRAPAARKKARIVVHLVAAGEIANDQIFHAHFVV